MKAARPVSPRKSASPRTPRVVIGSVPPEPVPNTVGVRELKASLSEHLRRVANGESIVVTDRGRAVARLVPADFSEGLVRLLRERRIHWSGRKPDLSTLPTVKLRGPGKTLSDYVIEDRHQD